MIFKGILSQHLLQHIFDFKLPNVTTVYLCYDQQVYHSMTTHYELIWYICSVTFVYKAEEISKTSLSTYIYINRINFKFLLYIMMHVILSDIVEDLFNSVNNLQNYFMWKISTHREWNATNVIFFQAWTSTNSLNLYS